MRTVVPALTFFKRDGSVGTSANAEYAEEVAAQDPGCVLLLGSTREDSALTARETSDLLMNWVRVLPKERLVATLWAQCPELAETAQSVTRSVLVPPLPDQLVEVVAARLSELGPDKCLLYSNPAISSFEFTVARAVSLRALGALPRGAKLSKVQPSALRGLRDSLGSQFEVWDGSDRDPAKSAAAGAYACVSQKSASLMLWGVPESHRAVEKYRSVPSGRQRSFALKTMVGVKLSNSNTFIRG